MEKKLAYKNSGIVCPICGADQMRYHKFSTDACPVEFSIHCTHCGEILFSTVELVEVPRTHRGESK